MAFNNPFQLMNLQFAIQSYASPTIGGGGVYPLYNGSPAATRIGAPNAVGGGFPDNAFACEQNSFVVKGEVHDAWTAGPAAAIGLSHCTWYYVGANCGGAPGVNIAPFSAHAIATACIMANV